MIRDPVEKLYSKIKANEPLVATCVKNFCDRLNNERDGKEPLNLSHACLSLAIGKHFTLGQSEQFSTNALQMWQQRRLSRAPRIISKNPRSTRSCKYRLPDFLVSLYNTFCMANRDTVLTRRRMVWSTSRSLPICHSWLGNHTNPILHGLREANRFYSRLGCSLHH